MGPKAKQSANRGRERGQQAKKQVQLSSQLQVVQNQSSLSVTSQQKILNVFASAFSESLRAYDVKSVMQEVKGHLFNRDFDAAFGKPEYLDIYALRWSAARALVYADLFTRKERRFWLEPAGLQQLREFGPTAGQAVTPSLPPLSSPPTRLTASGLNDTATGTLQNASNAFDGPTKIVTIGGGAGAELVALAAASHHFALSSPLHVVAVDAADWKIPVQSLARALTTPPPLSAYASQAIKDANKSFINPGQISIEFMHKNVHDLDLMSTAAVPPHVEDAGCTSRGDEGGVHDMSASSVFVGARLVTIMFTLNELFGASLQRTTALLLHLTDSMPAHSHLVVVDSPGSYSEIKLGKLGELKKYPMKWLLDHTLLDVAGKGVWTKVEGDDSVWFRLERDGAELQYPVDLENCRYQIHVYRKK